MSFIVEDGTGLPTATSFCDVAFADAYVADYATAAVAATWIAYTTLVKQAKLQKGTLYLEMAYKGQWVQRRTGQYQALSWPRSWVRDIDGFAIGSNVVPIVVKQATVEAALRDGTDLITDITTATIKSESVGLGRGALVTSTTYMGGKSPIPTYRKIDLLLQEYLMQRGRLERS